MELTLHVLDVGPGDEVIVPVYTYAASYSVICHVGTTPVMIDCAKSSFKTDYDKLPDLITEKTEIIIPTGLAGIMCDYKKIYEAIGSRKNLFEANNDIQKVFNKVTVMADNARGFEATQNGIHAGAITDFTCFSFHTIENLTTAEGGAVTWKSKKGINDEDLCKQYQLLSLHGQTRDALSKDKLGAWKCDIVMPAYKCDTADINAAIRLIQLKRYQKMLKWRHEIIRRYDEAFKNLSTTLLNHKDGNHMSSGHLYFVRMNNIIEEKQSEIIIRMVERGIACSVRYKPLPMLTAYKNLELNIKNYPNAYKQHEDQITLPLYNKLGKTSIDCIITCFKEILKACGCY